MSSEKGKKILFSMDLNVASTKYCEMILNVGSVFEICVSVLFKIIINLRTN